MLSGVGWFCLKVGFVCLSLISSVAILKPVSKNKGLRLYGGYTECVVSKRDCWQLLENLNGQIAVVIAMLTILLWVSSLQQYTQMNIHRLVEMQTHRSLQLGSVILM